MTTALDLVGSALRKINAVDPSEPIQSGDFTTAVSAMNRMLMRWEAKGITLGWSPLANPGDISPAPIEAEDAIIYNLAIMLAPEYGTQISPSVTSMANTAIEDLKNSIYNTQYIGMNLDMPRTSRGTRWNMYTDGPTG